MGLILVGIISGIVTGLGMGGGSILILILVTFMSVSQHIAQATNLIFFIPTAVIAIMIHINELFSLSRFQQKHLAQLANLQKLHL